MSKLVDKESINELFSSEDVKIGLREQNYEENTHGRVLSQLNEQENFNEDDHAPHIILNDDFELMSVDDNQNNVLNETLSIITEASKEQVAPSLEISKEKKKDSLLHECDFNQSLAISRSVEEAGEKENIVHSAVLQCYKNLKELGNGKFGTVYSAYDSVRNIIVAIKIIKKKRNCNGEKIISEMNIIKDVNCANIIEFYNCHVFEREVWLTMEYCGEDATLDSFIRRNGRLAESLGVYLTKQILNAVYVLHEKKIIHRDIKTANILITNRQSVDNVTIYTIKLIDYGCAVRFGENCEEFISGLAGTIHIIAPEVIQSDMPGSEVRYNYKADIWSFGCIVMEMLSGKEPWSDIYIYDKNKILMKLRKKETAEPPPFPEDISDKASNFLKCCLEVDPNRRYNAKKLKTHEFLT